MQHAKKFNTISIESADLTNFLPQPCKKSLPPPISMLKNVLYQQHPWANRTHFSLTHALNCLIDSLKNHPWPPYKQSLQPPSNHQALYLQPSSKSKTAGYGSFKPSIGSTPVNSRQRAFQNWRFVFIQKGSGEVKNPSNHLKTQIKTLKIAHQKLESKNPRALDPLTPFILSHRWALGSSPSNLRVPNGFFPVPYPHLRKTQTC